VDLDIVLLRDLLGRDVEEKALRTSRLFVEVQGGWAPSNGGVLVGCTHLEAFLPHAWEQCARFRGPRRRGVVDKANIPNLFQDGLRMDAVPLSQDGDRAPLVKSASIAVTSLALVYV